MVTGGYDRTIRFWEALSGINYRTIQYPDSVRARCVRHLRGAARGGEEGGTVEGRWTGPNPTRNQRDLATGSGVRGPHGSDQPDPCVEEIENRSEKTRRRSSRDTHSAGRLGPDRALQHVNTLAITLDKRYIAAAGTWRRAEAPQADACGGSGAALQPIRERW